MVTSGGVPVCCQDTVEGILFPLGFVCADVVGPLHCLSRNVSGQLPCHYGGGRNDARVGDRNIFADRVGCGGLPSPRCRVGRPGGVRRLQSGLRPRPLVDRRG